MRRQTAVVVFPDGRDAAAAGLRRGGRDFSKAVHRSKSFAFAVTEGLSCPSTNV